MRSGLGMQGEKQTMDRMDTMDRMTSDTVALSDDERQRCEVWTRVMGYHRPVESFNIGKRCEHAQRRFFLESRASAYIGNDHT